GAAHFAINASTGAITVTNSAALDYESITSYTLQITATDNGSPNLTDVETITINVLDIPENTAPVVNAAGPFSVAENAANNTVVGTVSATDAEGNAVTWSITGGNTDNIFTINASGQIRINSNTNLNYEWDNQYVLTVQAQDNGFGSMTGTRSITVNITDVNEAPTFDTHTALLAANPYLRYNATTGNYYQYVSTGATYAAASTNAAAQTLHGVAGHLVTITSAAENTYVRGLSNAQMWLLLLKAHGFGLGAVRKAALHSGWVMEGGVFRMVFTPTGMALTLIMAVLARTSS
ncbi:MAG TPA: cadherin repeat domain-containing protein, partial [Alphaproteobacteria bacterium]|nr:cadherin repeat domain-containing protein [Alphaproteobacteria bacterium]